MPTETTLALKGSLDLSDMASLAKTMTGNDFRILMVVLTSDVVTPAYLRDELNLCQPTIRRALNRFVESGLLSRQGNLFRRVKKPVEVAT